MHGWKYEGYLYIFINVDLVTWISVYVFMNIKGTCVLKQPTSEKKYFIFSNFLYLDDYCGTFLQQISII